MNCSNCGKNEATVFYKQLLNNQITELRLCLECAKSVQVPASPGLPAMDLLLSVLGKTPASASRQERLQCGRCGLGFADFRKTGTLGCQQCYESFGAPLAELLRRIHGGTTRHAGKAPAGTAGAKDERRLAQEAAKLRRQIEESVRREDYEEAARLRDLLRKLER